jgi:DNA repair protein RadA/Sms
MAIKSIYVCSSCGEQASKWSGKCLQCHSWNSLVEDAIDTKAFKKVQAKTIEISKVSMEDVTSRRLLTQIEEFDRVVGEGLVHDGFTLLSGDPGIGKSTLALQIGLAFAKQGLKVLYASGEESVSQISQRARRLNGTDIPDSFSLLSANQLESVVATIKKARPDFVIVDSAQTFHADEVTGVAGSIVQTRHLAEVLMHLAKQEKIPVLLIGHVTKDGNLAGPKVLEHLVDTVLYFEGEKYHELRMLRALKNRFGSTMEVGIFSMNEDGLNEVKNPSEVFLKGRKKNAIGSAITVTLEGTRPFLIEVQGLTNTADYSFPKRTASGFDLNRLHLLTAVLNKHARLNLDKQDVYINITGGFRVRDPAIDLAIISSLISSRKEAAIPEGVAVLGEVGLSGEIRPVSQEERRLKEIQKLGFTEVWGNIHMEMSGLKMRRIEDVKDLVKLLG